MRVKTAWRRWQAAGDPAAGAALARRYAYLRDDLAEVLEEFAGPPGQFADFARRQRLPPPEPTGPPLATAILAPELAPQYPALPRLYQPATAPRLTGPAVPPRCGSDDTGDGAAGGATPTTAPAFQPPSDPIRTTTLLSLAQGDQPAPIPPAPCTEAPVPALASAPTGKAEPTVEASDEAPSSPLPRILASPPDHAVRPPRPAAPRQVAACQALGYWIDGLSAVHRLVHPQAAGYRSDRIGLTIERDCVRLYAQDGSRAHFANLPARTEGHASVWLPRADVLTRDWGRPGRLQVFEDHVRFEPETGDSVWAAAIPARLPRPDDTPTRAGALVHRADLLAALREAVGGDLRRPALPEEVRLIRDDRRLLVLEVPGRGLVRLPVRYVSGELDVRLAPRWLVEAIGCAPADEVCLESLGRFQPLRLESGWFTAMVATRAEESLL
jgi:hypothetical protein